jgi:hypothetical protein
MPVLILSGVAAGVMTGTLLKLSVPLLDRALKTNGKPNV